MEERAEAVSRKVIEELRRLQMEKGLSYQKLAELSGVDRSYIGLLTKGKRRPTLEVTIRLAWALDTTLSSLLASCEANSD